MVIYQISKRNLKLQYVKQVEDLCKVTRLINGSIQMTSNVAYIGKKTLRNWKEISYIWKRNLNMWWIWSRELPQCISDALKR